MGKTNRPAIPKTLVTSAARTTSSNSGNLKDTSTDFASNGKTVAIQFDVTAFTVNGAEATGMARFYVDTSPDNGTTWFAAAIPLIVTSSTATRRVVFRNGVPDGITNIDGILSNVAMAPVTTTTTQLATLMPLSRDKRIRWELGDDTPSGNGASVTFGVYAFSDVD